VVWDGWRRISSFSSITRRECLPPVLFNTTFSRASTVPLFRAFFSSEALPCAYLGPLLTATSRKRNSFLFRLINSMAPPLRLKAEEISPPADTNQCCSPSSIKRCDQRRLPPSPPKTIRLPLRFDRVAPPFSLQQFVDGDTRISLFPPPSSREQVKAILLCLPRPPCAVYKGLRTSSAFPPPRGLAFNTFFFSLPFPHNSCCW